MNTRRLVFTLGLIWIGLVGTGTFVFNNYVNDPGDSGNKVRSWPADSGLKRTPQSLSLLVFLHPECSCSQATLGELDRILVRAPKNLKTYVIFIRPQDWKKEETKTSLWKHAKKIPGVQVILDLEGKEAGLFGARTSGHTLVYNQEGQLLFAGGITGSRGHMGDNIGQASVSEILRNQSPSVTETHVFGCGLFSPQGKGS